MAKSSKIYLCKDIHIDNTYQHVLNYTVQQMLDLCTSQSHLVASNNNYTFIRESENTISVGFTYDQCLQSNYIAFQNTDYSGKWFFAWIKDVKFISPAATQITFDVDAWSTWFNDITIKRSFVIREHVNSDGIGEHTLDEPVGTGEYVNNNFGTINTTGLTQKIVIGVSNILGGMQYYKNRQYTGVYSGLYLYTFESHGNHTPEYWVSEFIRAYDKSGMGSSIVTLYLVPQDYISVDSGDWLDLNVDGVDIHYGLIKNSIPYSTQEISIPINTTINGYTPKNKKLFVAPFNYLYLSNNVGSDVIYHYEDFIDNAPKFLCEGVISPGCNTRVFPVNYKKQADDTTGTFPRCSYQYGITAGKLPVCSWNNDAYTNWMTQNSVNVITGFLQSGVEIFKGASSGDWGSVGQNSISAIQTGDMIRRASMIPNNVGGNVNGSDIAYSSRNLNVTYSQMSVRREVAEYIDNFFTKYGYKVNKLKVPNITGRQYWNYIQISNDDVLGIGSVPTKYMDVINQIVHKGVTIWHNHSNIGDYSLNNSIV